MEDRPWYGSGLRFTCGRCGNCCSGTPGTVLFAPNEQNAIARFLGILPFEFLQRYARRVNGHWSLTEVERDGSYDCVFLTRDAGGRAGCAIHPVRPTQCRTWPFWPENLKDRRGYERLADGCTGVRDGLNGSGRPFTRREIDDQAES